MFGRSPQPTSPPESDGRVIPFRRKAVATASAESVASVIMALEEQPLFPPVILAARGMDGIQYVGASIGSHAFRLTPAEARLAGDCLWSDPSIPGFADVAARFRDAADAADRAFLRTGS